MSIETNLNQSPFFDDFNETKNFHRVLFRPGYSVQARELTQLQTILQNQVERFGDEVLDQSTIINGCDVEIQKWDFVRLRDKDADNTVVSLPSFFDGGVIANCTVTGETSGVTARLLSISEGSESAAPNFLTVHVSYTNSGTDKSTKTFSSDEVLTFKTTSSTSDTETFRVAAKTIVNGTGGYATTGNGLGARATEGVIYSKGHFIRSEDQSIVVSKYTTNPSTKVGFETIETIVDSNADSSLLDNASGATNYTAPGASRLKISTKLKTKSLTDANTAGFFVISDIQDGEVTRDYTDTGYGDLGREIARRTYEESGDYAIEPFAVRVEEHLRTSVNGGIYSSSSSPVAGDRNKLIVEVEPSIGYVSGYRTELVSTVREEIPKGLEFDVKNDVVVGQNYGSYVLVDEVAGFLDFQGFEQIQLRAAKQTAITQHESGDNTPTSGTHIGFARVRGIEYHSGNSGTPTGQFKVFLFEIEMFSGYEFSATKSLAGKGSTDPRFKGDTILEDGKTVLKEPSLLPAIFDLQSSGVKTLKDAANSVQTQYVYRNEKTVDFQANGADATVTANTAHSGGTNGNNETGDPLSASTKRSILVIANENGKTIAQAGTVTQSATTVTGIGTAFDTAYKVGDTVQIGADGANGGDDDYLVVITAITSATVMTVQQSFTISSAAAHYKVFKQGHIFDSANTSIVSTASSHTVNLGQRTFQSNITCRVVFNTLRSNASPTSKTINKDKFVHINTQPVKPGTVEQSGVTITGSGTTFHTHYYVGAKIVVADTAAQVITNINGQVITVSGSGQTVSAGASHAQDTSDGPWYLGVPDVLKVSNIYYGDKTGVTVSDPDARKHFVLDNGQRDTHYETARIIKRPGSTLDTYNKGFIVKLSYFGRDRSQGDGFLTIDSYPVNDANPEASNAIATSEIPTYTSKSGYGTVFDLRDSVDFRPSRTPNAILPSSVGTQAGAPTNPGKGATFDVSSAGSYFPTAGENFQADVQSYLPRIDKVTLRPDGQVFVIKGASEISPKVPRDAEGSMTLATIFVPPYPSLSPEAALFYSKPEYEVRTNRKNNRRFTMEHLRKLQKQVVHNRFLIDLNAAEIEALKASLLRDDDPIGAPEPPIDVIVVDPLPPSPVDDDSNYGLLNTMRPGSLRFSESPLRPIPKLQDIEMQLRDGYAGVSVGATQVSLTETGYATLIDQPYATRQRRVSVKTTTPAKLFNGQMTIDKPVCRLQQLPDTAPPAAAPSPVDTTGGGTGGTITVTTPAADPGAGGNASYFNPGGWGGYGSY